MSYDTQCQRLAEHFLSDHQHTPEQVADLAQTIQGAVEDWFTLNEPKERKQRRVPPVGPVLLGFADEVRRSVAEGYDYHAATHFYENEAVSPATVCAFRCTAPELSDYHRMLMAEKHGGSFKADGWEKRK